MEVDLAGVKRPREPLVSPEEADTKKPRLEKADTASAATPTPPSDGTPASIPPNRPSNETEPYPVSRLGLKPVLPGMPPSLELVTGVKADLRARKGMVGQEEVGIIGYAGPEELRGVRGVIKQRFTDFLVNEVLPNGEVLHLKDIGRPVEDADVEPANGDNDKAQSNPLAADHVVAPSTSGAPEASDDSEPLPETLANLASHRAWSTVKAQTLRKHFSDETVVSLHALLVEGKNPPPKPDAGWGSRKPKEVVDPEETAMNVDSADKADSAGTDEAGPSESSLGGRGRGQGRDRGRGRGRGGRGGRGGGRQQDGDKWWTSYEDEREVVSQPIPSKEERGTAHKIMRELFPMMFDTGTKQLPGEEATRLTIKWSRGQDTQRREKPGQKSQKKLPQYIHFTLQKSNRETLDALAHLSRLFNCNSKDLSVCGTKDKRAVTVQRVCLRRGHRTLDALWKTANGIKLGRRNLRTAVSERAERGTRIGDLEYSDRYLELGMLRGNYFVITLRNVQTENQEEIDSIMISLRDRGFINFYGMQRFGTSTVPTHVTGLHILQGKWGEAIDGILSLREGEHPDCVRARLAWLEDGDLGKALELMPRRCVAERNVWEFWKRVGGTADKLGALGCIPRNLRTMYVHAYQSYIWNLVVSERIKLSSTQPLVGDLVFVNPTDDELAGESGGVRYPARKPVHATSSSQEVHLITEQDIAESKYTIFDVIMPLPGFDVEYPEGKIGELYEVMMKADGLDPHRMRREQREYSLPGSYRRVINKPQHVSWKHIRYTDPDIGLTQSDEDKILNLNPVAEDDPEGKFRALRVELQLGASAYATMALREVTREETATWWQIGLTVKGEDQKHKGRAKGVFGNAAEGEEAEGEEGEEVLGEDQLGTMPE